jgi:hypothetical protein
MDTIIIANHNLAFLKARILSGGVEQGVPFEGDISGDAHYVRFDSISGDQVEITVDKTAVKGDTRKIGEVYIGAFLLSPPHFDSYSPSRTLRRSGHLQTLDGGIITFRGRKKYRAGIGWKNLTKQERDKLEELWTDNAHVNIYPESLERPFEFFDVAWSVNRSLDVGFSEIVKPAGYDLSAELIQS